MIPKCVEIAQRLLPKASRVYQPNISFVVTKNIPPAYLYLQQPDPEALFAKARDSCRIGNTLKRLTSTEPPQLICPLTVKPIINEKENKPLP
jgi:hypothetical protein